ncbi:hypothetical protein [Mycolicibacterium brisbanense]|uniref:Uncharacterized protein n=1 Tax=Mycolicibacterium brisbanense TaxID=146020 RepID=A0A100VW02_9MYCO|nr:hypothetical protein [Mycolicibacterium brisbanense]MCV7159425.1 hypothetical protein [Mycolicibacterium brisbanense]GAS86953.1 uncharacterized protein RMCB_1049 [Mycolicibacterium brisbanense]
MESFRFTYEGPAGTEGALAQELKTQGVTSVDYEPSTEQRNLPEAVEIVRTVFEVGGDASLIITVGQAVRKITKRFRGSSVTGLPAAASPASAASAEDEDKTGQDSSE